MFDAMMLSAALAGVARVFAETLNDPSVTTTLMPLLYETFEARIGPQLKKQKGAMSSTARQDRVLGLTKALSGGDPVTPVHAPRDCARRPPPSRSGRWPPPTPR